MLCFLRDFFFIAILVFIASHATNADKCEDEIKSRGYKGVFSHDKYFYLEDISKLSGMYVTSYEGLMGNYEHKDEKNRTGGIKKLTEDGETLDWSRDNGVEYFCNKIKDLVLTAENCRDDLIEKEYTGIFKTDIQYALDLTSVDASTYYSSTYAFTLAFLGSMVEDRKALKDDATAKQTIKDIYRLDVFKFVCNNETILFEGSDSNLEPDEEKEEKRGEKIKEREGEEKVDENGGISIEVDKKQKDAENSSDKEDEEGGQSVDAVNKQKDAEKSINKEEDVDASITTSATDDSV